MEVRVGAGDLHGLVPDRRLQAELRAPMELHEGRPAVGIDQPKAVDAEAFHHPQRARQGAVRHDPHHHVHRFRRQRDVVPERVVRRGRLREAAVRFHLHRVDEVGELDRVLDEEDRDVVADEVPVAFLGIELDGEAAHVARRIDRPGTAGHGREAGEDGRALADLGQDPGRRVLRQRLRQLEEAVHAGTAGMHDALGDAFVIEVGDLLPQDEVLEQRRPARVGAQRVLVVRDGCALIGRQRRMLASGGLVQLTAGAGCRRLRSGDGLSSSAFSSGHAWTPDAGRRCPTGCHGNGHAVPPGLAELRRRR